VKNPEIEGENRMGNAKENHNGCRRRKESECVHAETEEIWGFDGGKTGK
jgi:hypothetical protein